MQSAHVDTQAFTLVFAQACHLRLSQCKGIRHCALLRHCLIIVCCVELLIKRAVIQCGKTAYNMYNEITRCPILHSSICKDKLVEAESMFRDMTFYPTVHY